MRIFLLIITIIIPQILDAFLIESMDYTGTLSHGSDADVTYNLESVPGKVGNCVKLSYEFTGGTWLQFYYDITKTSFYGADQIRFYHKGLGNANTIEFYLEDTEGNSKTTNFYRESNRTNWTEKIVPLSFFNNLDLLKIKKMKFAISKQPGDDGGSGQFYIDKIALYQSTNVPAIYTNVDDFEDATDTTNLLGKPNSSFIYGPTSTISATTPTSNFCTLKYTKGTGTGLASWVIKLTGLNIENYEFLSFQVRGAIGNEKVAIGLKNSKWDASYIYLGEYLLGGGITTTSQTTYIPISHFSELSYVTNMEELVIVFQDDSNESGFGGLLGKGDATIIIDNIQFYTPPKTSGYKGTIDDMEIALKYSSWDYGSGEGSRLDASVVDGYDGNAIKLDYNITGSQQWVWMERGFYLNLFEGGGLKFYFKGTGDANNLEVKLTDSDNTTYIRKFYKFTDTKDIWKEISFGFDELYFFSSGDDDNLNLKKIKNIYFAIAKYEQGKSGTVYFDELRCESPTSYFAELDKEDIVKEFKIDNNPFSPNHDGYNDEVKFYFTLNKRAQVQLRIYNLAGNVIKEFPAKEYNSEQEHYISWNGIDDRNKDVRNGIYFIQIKAETPEGKVQRINYSIAVVK